MDKLNYNLIHNTYYSNNFFPGMATIACLVEFLIKTKTKINNQNNYIFYELNKYPELIIYKFH